MRANVRTPAKRSSGSSRFACSRCRPTRRPRARAAPKRPKRAGGSMRGGARAGHRGGGGKLPAASQRVPGSSPPVQEGPGVVDTVLTRRSGSTPCPGGALFVGTPASALMIYAAPATFLLLVLNVLVAVYTLVVDPSVLERWAFRPARVAREREWGRWITAGFVHVGLAHLAFNMITLFFFGPFIERQLGSWRFLVLYFGAELAANALTYWRHRDN